jgi:L-asparaginase
MRSIGVSAEAVSSGVTSVTAATIVDSVNLLNIPANQLSVPQQNTASVFATSSQNVPVEKMWMDGAKGVDVRTAQSISCEFPERSPDSRTVRDASRVSSLASTSASPRMTRRFTPTQGSCRAGFQRATILRNHQWTDLSHRGGADHVRSLACAHPARTWCADRADAVLWSNGGRCRADVGRMAGESASRGAASAGRRVLNAGRMTRALRRLRSLTTRLVPLLTALALAGPAAAMAAPPHVRVIATGGTISNSSSGRLTAEQLVARLPHRAALGRIDTESFSNTISAALSLEDWVRLSRHIGRLLAEADAPDGIVVTSGTDTLEELAWFLHLTVPGERPIVVVGAMRRPDTAEFDGTRNLEDALRVAATPASRGRGTLIVLHGEVHAAVSAQKRHTTSVSAFDEPPATRLGLIANGRVRYARRPAPRPRPGILPIAQEGSLPRVDLFVTYQGATGDLLELAVRAGARGLVLASAGAGALTPGQAEVARNLAAAGTVVVISSRAGAGEVGVFDPLDQLVISAGTVSPLKARLLLMLALANELPPERIAVMFNEISAAAVRRLR